MRTCLQGSVRLLKSSVNLLAGLSVLRGFLPRTKHKLGFAPLGIKTIQSSRSSLAFASSNNSPATLAYRAEFGIAKKHEWTRNLAAEPADLFPLAPAAANAGLKAAFALPITYNHHVDGVLMFPCARGEGGRRRLIQVISRIATQLGFALQHKRLEEELLKQAALLRSMKLGDRLNDVAQLGMKINYGDQGDEMRSSKSECASRRP